MEIKIIKKTKVNLDLSAEHRYYGKIKGKWNLYFTNRLNNVLSFYFFEDIDPNGEGTFYVGSFYLMFILAGLTFVPENLFYFLLAIFILIPIIFIGILQRIYIKPISFKTKATETFDKYDDQATKIITNSVNNYIQYNKLKDKNYKDSITKITINSTKADNCSYCNSNIVNNKCQGCGA